jgi:hypothetical protein
MIPPGLRPGTPDEDVTVDEEEETTGDEVEVDEIDEAELDEEFEEVIEDADDDDDVVAVVADQPEEDETEAAVPARRKVSEEEEDDEEEADPDDVEADLDTILKDRIASGDDLDEEEEEEVPDRNDPDATEGVAAKKEGEFTCDRCFMIVHPRQFGRRERLVCPEGYDDCPSMKRVARMLK